MKKKGIFCKAAAWLLSCGIFFGAAPAVPARADGADTTTLRIISTSDLHGQSVTMNYDSASAHPAGSLAQAATLINGAKKSLKYGDTLLVDIGDAIYGYGSDCINRGVVDGVEYMYAEFAALGYDALTIGNHDFDYGYDYLQDQIGDAGLEDKTVLSNVYDAKTRETVWAENMLVTKKLKTAGGRTLTVDIGIFGVTLPELSTHYDHSKLLSTKDIVESSEEQVKKLKAKGADIVIALAHTGIGSEEYVQMSENAAYEMSKIDGLDAIVGGHAHVNFPSDDEDVQKFYEYPGVSKDGHLNGKPYVGVRDHGAAIGVIDLTLRENGGKVEVAGSSASLKYVDKSTKEDPVVTKVNDAYQDQLDEIFNTGIIDVDAHLTDYFGPLEDNAIVQAANEAKIHYGLEYINQFKPEFKDCPVIAVTPYALDDNLATQGFVDIYDEVTVADTLNIQNMNKEFAFIYSINGDQIREWLEWLASAYQKPSSVGGGWQDPVVKKYVEEENMMPVLNKDWIDNWSGFLVFDGIEYEIDPSKSPRYNKDGKIINKKAHRVTSLTCNGVEVDDDMEFAIVTQRMNSSFCAVPASIAEYVICNKRVYINDLLQDYLEEQGEYGPLSARTDENWCVDFPEGMDYLVKASWQSVDSAPEADWYVARLKKNSHSAYYQAELKAEHDDDSPPMLVLGLGNAKATGHPIPIAVQASDKSGIRQLKYYAGVAEADSPVWQTAQSVTGRSFTVSENGTYSVMAEDARGNRIVKHISVDNYDPGVLEIPDVTKCTNRSKQILGVAEPGAMVYAIAEDEMYSAKAGADGKFAISTPKLPADSTVAIWAEGEGKKSAKLYQEVKRTGANEPDVEDLTNTSEALTGFLNDSKYCRVIAISSDDVVYVPEDGGVEAYEGSSVYDYDKKVVKVPYEVLDGQFFLYMPVPRTGTSFKVYSVDWTNKESVAKSVKATEAGPNQPKLEQVYAVDDCIYGKIPGAKDGPYSITVENGGMTYTGSADEDGFFAIQADAMKEGSEVVVTASDVLDGKTRNSARAKAVVESCDGIDTAGSQIAFNPIDSKATTLSGHMDGYEGGINLLIGDAFEKAEVGSDGGFSCELDAPLAVGTSIMAMARDGDGSIVDANKTEVTLALPDTPLILTDPVYDTSKKVKVFCVDKATAVVKVGDKYYKQPAGVYKEELGGYVYTIELTKKHKAGKEVVAFMMNDAGKGGKFRTKVEADPDAAKKAADKKNKKDKDEAQTEAGNDGAKS